MIMLWATALHSRVIFCIPQKAVVQPARAIALSLADATNTLVDELAQRPTGGQPEILPTDAADAEIWGSVHMLLSNEAECC